MNFQQLEYIVALEKHRHFAKAAAECNVTQPTLSMMILKLENELGTRIFNRAAVPVEPTKAGKEIISRSRDILFRGKLLREYAYEVNNENAGVLNIGIIPTLAPYLLPLFLKSFTLAFPQIKLLVKELQTKEITEKLKTGTLDVGLMPTPESEAQLWIQPLFYEEFHIYVSGEKNFQPKKKVLPADIENSKLWMLHDGHCMRNQVQRISGMKSRKINSSGVHYEAGNIETLINMVDKSQGITIIPYLATRMLKNGQKEKLVAFADPVPSREICLVTIKDFPRQKLLENLRASILGTIPDSMRRAQGRNIVSVE